MTLQAPHLDATGRGRRWLPRRHRLLIGCLILVLCGAGTGAALVLGQVLKLKDALSQNSALALPGGSLASSGYGDAETLLLVGDDRRTLTGEFKYYRHAVLPHSNEMLLVRIDPNKPYISMMSIPRELEVRITPPGRPAVTTRFNYAYTAGGIPLLVSTIKRVLGVPVNHVMVITFGRFKRAVDEMGCVLGTIDRRYYHVNVPGGDQYQEIDLQPGYQNLCGSDALEFVSYRHGDVSLVRDARDQSLLLDVKKQYGPTLADNIGKFERIFGKAVQTDRGLHSASGILDLAGTLVSSAARAVRQVHFQVNLVPPQATPCGCVTATPQQIHASVDSFLNGPPPAAPQHHGAAAAARAAGSRRGLARLPLAPVSATDVAQARIAAARTPVLYEFPRVRDRGGLASLPYLRDYVIHGPDGGTYPTYVAVFASGQLGQFYDVQGTSWKNPPLLTSPTQTVHAAGRDLALYYQSGQLEMVAWHEHGASYWVQNSLTQALSPGEMLAIAEQTRPFAGATPGQLRRVSLRGAHVRFGPPPTTPTDVRQTVGSAAGLVALVAILLLGVLTLRRRRSVAELRAELDAQLQREGQVAATLARRLRPVARRR